MGISKSIAWSFTRHKSLAGCLRAHWFMYFRVGEPEEPQMLAYSKMITRPMFVGQMADIVAGLALIHARKEGHIPEPERVEAYARKCSQENLASSRKHALTVQRGDPPPFNAQVLDDHVMGGIETWPDEEVERRVVVSSQGFVGSQFFAELASRPIETWLKPRRRDDPLPDAWPLGDQLIASAPDGWLAEPDRFIVLDWKASAHERPEYSLQVAVYALWAIHQRQARSDAVYSQIVLMPTTPAFEPRRVSELEQEAAVFQIGMDWRKERSLAVEGQDKRGHVVLSADREAFPPSPSQEGCKLCRFRAICPDRGDSPLLPVEPLAPPA